MTPEDIMKDNRQILAFNVWAKEKGISLDHVNDWYPWWECWRNGYDFAKIEHLIK